MLFVSMLFIEAINFGDPGDVISSRMLENTLKKMQSKARKSPAFCGMIIKETLSDC